MVNLVIAFQISSHQSTWKRLLKFNLAGITDLSGYTVGQLKTKVIEQVQANQAEYLRGNGEYYYAKESDLGRIANYHNNHEFDDSSTLQQLLDYDNATEECKQATTGFKFGLQFASRERFDHCLMLTNILPKKTAKNSSEADHEISDEENSEVSTQLDDSAARSYLFSFELELPSAKGYAKHSVHIDGNHNFNQLSVSYLKQLIQQSLATDSEANYYQSAEIGEKYDIVNQDNAIYDDSILLQALIDHELSNRDFISTHKTEQHLKQDSNTSANQEGEKLLDNPENNTVTIALRTRIKAPMVCLSSHSNKREREANKVLDTLLTIGPAKVGRVFEPPSTGSSGTASSGSERSQFDSANCPVS